MKVFKKGIVDPLLGPSGEVRKTAISWLVGLSLFTITVFIGLFTDLMGRPQWAPDYIVWIEAAFVLGTGTLDYFNKKDYRRSQIEILTNENVENESLDELLDP